MIANASSQVDRCRNDPVGIIVIHTGTHHTGAVIHAWKRHGCNLIEIYTHVLLQKLEFGSMVCHGEWTTFANALIVLSGVVTDDFWLFHLNAEVLFNKIDGSKDR